MTDQEDNLNLGKTVLNDNNQQEIIVALIRKNLFRSLIVFLSQLLTFF